MTALLPVISRISYKPYRTAGALVAVLLCAALAPISWLVPKKARRLLFFPTHDALKFSGNLRQMMLHLRKLHPEFECVWAVSCARVAAQLRARSVPAIHYRIFPWKAAWRAEHILLDSINWRFTFGRFSLIQLWHGVGYKHIGLTNPNRSSLELYFMRRHFAKYRLITASSPADQQVMVSAFGQRRIEITGTPRNDSLVRPRKGRSFPEKLLWFSDYRRVVLYAPTFRDSGTASPFTAELWNQLQQLAADQNAVLVIKKHPRDDRLNVPGGLPNIRDVSGESVDLQDILAAADVLVTDYSSVATDFSLTGRPIIFYTYDMDEYLSGSRSCYYDLRKVLPGPFAATGSNLLALLADSTWFNEPSYRARYNSFRDHFHAFHDGHSSERVAVAVTRLCSVGA